MPKPEYKLKKDGTEQLCRRCGGDGCEPLKPPCYQCQIDPDTCRKHAK